MADSARLRVLDTLGVALAAVGLQTSAAVAGYVAAQGGSAQAVALGLAGSAPTPLAALLNGTLAHSLDFDDTHLPSVLHPSSSVVPAALAVAQEVRSDGDALIRAVAAGIEVCVRLGMVGYDPGLHTSLFFEHGQHATSICGALGAAVAAAALYGMEPEGIAHAMAVAASMASGLIEANRTGGTVKRVHCGWAAHAGVSAAQLVRFGITGPLTVLEGRFGFFRAWLHRDVSTTDVLGELGTTWEIPGILFKPYPANHFTHAGADAALRLRSRGLRPEMVADIRLGVAAPTVPTIGEPADAKQAPETGYQAQFSGPYVVAAALLGGSGLGLGIADFTDQIVGEPRRRELMRKIRVEADERCSAIFPLQFPAILEVRTTDGQLLREEVLTNRGGPSNPLTTAELRTKFLTNAGPVLGDDGGAEFADAVLALGAASEPHDLMSRLGSKVSARTEAG